MTFDEAVKEELSVRIGARLYFGTKRRRKRLSQHTTKTASSQASAAGGNDIFHVAVFRFAKEHVSYAVEAFRALASASRQESGNLRYDIYRGIEDDQVFYVVEH